MRAISSVEMARIGVAASGNGCRKRSRGLLAPRARAAMMLWDGRRPDGLRIVHPPSMTELLILLLGALRAALRSRADLVSENLLLRHQLAVLTRPGRRRPPFRARDTLLWVLARRLCTG
jgi:hypothetical protein